MAFRNDLGAAHARLAELEQELTAAQARIGELERELAEERARYQTELKQARLAHRADTSTQPLPAASAAPELVLPGERRLRYQRPWSYFPLWVHLWRGIRLMARYRFPLPGTDSLVGILFYYLVGLPGYYLAVLPLFFLVVVPYVACIALVTTPLLALGKALGGLRLSRTPILAPQPPPQSIKGYESLVTLFVIFMTTFPVLMPILCGLAAGRG